MTAESAIGFVVIMSGERRARGFLIFFAHDFHAFGRKNLLRFLPEQPSFCVIENLRQEHIAFSLEKFALGRR